MVPARRGPIFVHGSLWVWSACRPPNLHLGTVGDRYTKVSRTTHTHTSTDHTQSHPHETRKS